MKNNELESLYNTPAKNKIYHFLGYNDLNNFIVKEVVSAILTETNLNILINDEETALNLGNVFHLKSNLNVISPEYNHEFGNIDHSFISYLSKIYTTNTKLYTNILGQLTIVDIIKLLSDIREEVTPYPFMIPEINFEFTPNEFYDLKQSISKFIEYSRYHNQDGLRARILSTYNTNTIQSRELTELHHLVRQWYSELNYIKKELLSGLNEIEKSKIDHKIVEYHQVKLEFEALKTKIATFIDQYGGTLIEKPSILSLSANKKDKYKSWQVIQNMDSSLGLDPEEAYKIIGDSIISNDKLFISDKKAITNNLKSINDLNTVNHNIKTASNQLGKLIQSINANQVFIDYQECNATSITKKLDFIDQLKYKMEIFLQCNNIQSVIEWHEQLEKLDQSFIKFLDQLKSCNIDEWRYQFEYFYLKAALQKYNIELLSGLKTDSYNFLLDVNRKIENLQLTIIQQYNNSVHKIIEDLKSTNKSFYKSINGSTLLPEALSETLILKSWIKVSDVSDFESEKINQQRTKNILISNSHEVANDNINLQLVKSEGYTHYLIPTGIEINNYLKETNITLQLNIAKGLSYNLFPYLNIVRAYQTKMGNIISLIDGHWQEDLAISLQPFGSKEFKIENPDHLTDFILSTDRPLFIITQDGVLNPKEPEIIDQLLIMAQCQRAGITFLNISSLEFLKISNTQIQEMIQQLGFGVSNLAEKQEIIS